MEEIIGLYSLFSSQPTQYKTLENNVKPPIYLKSACIALKF